METPIELQQTEKTYHRLNVGYVKKFCGWEPIAELLKYTGSDRNELYFLSLIKSGGRAGEVLALNTSNFKIDKRVKAVMVSGMKLEKHFVTKKLPDGTKQRQHVEATREEFPVLLKEPLTTEWLTLISKCEGLLFPSPYKDNDSLTVSWGYKLIRKISDELPKPLFEQLGLNQPFKDAITGETIADTIHLWQHWARSERAKQLAEEYGFKEGALMSWFGWLDFGTAHHYGKVGAKTLAKKMSNAQP